MSLGLDQRVKFFVLGVCFIFWVRFLKALLGADSLDGLASSGVTLASSGVDLALISRYSLAIPR